MGQEESYKMLYEQHGASLAVCSEMRDVAHEVQQSVKSSTDTIKALAKSLREQIAFFPKIVENFAYSARASADQISEKYKGADFFPFLESIEDGNTLMLLSELSSLSGDTRYADNADYKKGLKAISEQYADFQGKLRVLERNVGSFFTSEELQVLSEQLTFIKPDGSFNFSSEDLKNIKNCSEIEAVLFDTLNRNYEGGSSLGVAFDDEQLELLSGSMERQTYLKF